MRVGNLFTAQLSEDGEKWQNIRGDEPGGADINRNPDEQERLYHIGCDITCISKFSDISLHPWGEVFEAGKKYMISTFLKARKGSLDITLKPGPWIEP